MTFLEKHDYDKTCMNTNTWQAKLRKQQEYSIIILKTEKKQQEHRALELKSATQLKIKHEQT